MPFAGFVAAQGDLHPAGVVAAGVAGSLAGALPWYAAGYWFGSERLKRLADRYGRWITISRAELERAEGWFARRGLWAVLFGRLIPAIRTLISVPAGIARLPIGYFLLCSFVGTLIWTCLLTVLGYILEDQYNEIAVWVNFISVGVVTVIVAGYLYRVARPRKES